jgi:hypothetical protein
VVGVNHEKKKGSMIRLGEKEKDGILLIFYDRCYPSLA